MAKMSKCLFYQKEVQFLGHVVVSDGVHLDPNKVDAMVRCPIPNIVKALKVFLGLTGYYRHFVRGYTGIIAPLTDLLKKDGFFLV